MAVYEDIEDAGVNQFAKGNPVRGGLWIAYGVAWNAFSFGSLEKNSDLVEKYKGGKINDRQFNRGVAINTAQASAELAITCAGGSALTGAKTIGSAAVIGAGTGFATTGVEVAGNRTEATVTGQQYKQTVTQDIFQIGTGTVLGAGFGAGAKWFEVFLTHGGNAGNVLQSPSGVGARFNMSSTERMALLKKHDDIARPLLTQGKIEVPTGTMSAETMADLTQATGRELALVRMKAGQRMLFIGDANAVSLPVKNIQRIIAHTHPSGVLELSLNTRILPNGSFAFVGDIPTLNTYFPMQKSTVIIGPAGNGVRLRP